ncbi:TRAP transporter large permease [Pseudohoeflea coraliihabitans]|uniref:TRAP transporter large permease protein n=1 Tax=Pseudohoeflea coraliihabitans TaxID=2860393 RepID=A0ABS6WPQ0_9HYPH|nr:TRAP transporter large permease [Pseudohoeflea sp. DP4N28-3]MBW3097049.1 TRAP transporter large permease [Pseudohoeflea sp. DP4N28-3]
MTGAAILLAFVLLMLVQVPIVLALIAIAFAYFYVSGFPLTIVPYTMYKTLNTFTIVAIPMFIFMGELLSRFGFAADIIRITRRMFREKFGYSLRLNVILSLIFSGMSGSAIADIGATGRMLINASDREGIRKPFAAGLTMASATIGPIFPPSIPLLVYAIAANTSSVRMLIAGVVPAIAIAAILYIFVSIYIAMLRRRHTNATPTPQALKTDTHTSGSSGTEPAIGEIGGAAQTPFWRDLALSLPTLSIIPAITGGMIFGLLSPSEVGAAAVVYILVLAFAYGRFTLGKMWLAFRAAIVSSSAVVILLAAGSLYSTIMVNEGISQLAASAFDNIGDNPLVFFLIINLLLIIVGMFIDGLTIIILLTPVLMPIALSLGIQPEQLGIVMVFNTMIGMMTPPFGLSIFAVASVSGLKLGEILRSILPFYAVMLVCLFALSAVPAISQWLPGTVFQ